MSLTPDKIALKRATGEMILGVGGVEAAASFCRVGKSKLSENQGPQNEDSFVALDVVADLEPLARSRPGWPHVTRQLCRTMGGAFVELPDAKLVGRDLPGCAALHAKEASEVTARLFEATRGGPLTAALIDSHELEREAREAVEASVQLLAMIQAIKGEGE